MRLQLRGIRGSGQFTTISCFAQGWQGPSNAWVCGVYSDSPAARSPSAWSKYTRYRQILSPRNSKMPAYGVSTGAPLALPRPLSLPSTSTRSPRSRYSAATFCERLPVLAGIRGELFDALASAVAATAVESPDDCRVPLEVGGRELGEQGINIAAVVGINHPPGHIHLVWRPPPARIPPGRCRRRRGPGPAGHAGAPAPGKWHKTDR